MNKFQQVVTSQYMLVIVVFFICIWAFAPRPQQEISDVATFNNIKIHTVGTRYLTFAYEGKVIRLDVKNMPNYGKKLHWIQAEDARIDLSVLPAAKAFDVVGIQTSAPFPS